MAAAWKWFWIFSLLFASMTLARPRTQRSQKRAVDATPLLTNAARFQAGLGPMKPRSLFSPTRASGEFCCSYNTQIVVERLP